MTPYGAYEYYWEIPYEIVVRWFYYKSDTGQLFRIHKNGTIHEIPNTRDDGVHFLPLVGHVRFSGFIIPVTHIMFMLMERRWPKREMHIDHRDGARENCIWLNLREATISQNGMNKATEPLSDGRVRGVYKNGSGWRVLVRDNGHLRQLGTYKTIEEANKVATEFRLTHQGEFSVEASRNDNKHK